MVSSNEMSGSEGDRSRNLKAIWSSSSTSENSKCIGSRLNRTLGLLEEFAKWSDNGRGNLAWEELLEAIDEAVWGRKVTPDDDWSSLLKDWRFVCCNSSTASVMIEIRLSRVWTSAQHSTICHTQEYKRKYFYTWYPTLFCLKKAMSFFRKCSHKGCNRSSINAYWLIRLVAILAEVYVAAMRI